MKQPQRKNLEILLVFLLFAGVSFASALLQRPTALNQGLGWDGCSYYSMAEQILQGKKPQGPGPFIFRLGTPFLATLLGPHNLLRGFLTANIIAAGLLATLMVVWLRMYIDNWKLRLLLVGLFLIQWHGPARAVYFYPDMADPWAIAFCLAGLICMNRLRSRFSPGLLVLLCFICFVGFLFREFVALVGVAAVFTFNPVYHGQGVRIRKPALALLAPLASAFLGAAVSHSLVKQGPLPHPVSDCGGTYNLSYSFIHDAAHWMYTQPLGMYLHGWLIAFGPVLFLLIFAWREVGRFLWEHQYQLAYLAGVVGLGWIGGQDTERYALWAMPVIYVLCGKVIEKRFIVLRSALLIAFLVSTQAVSERVFWTIPDYLGAGQPGALTLASTPPAPSWFFLVPFGNIANLNLLSHFGRNMSISFLQYCSVGLLLLVWLHCRQKWLGQGDSKAYEKWRWI